MENKDNRNLTHQEQPNLIRGQIKFPLDQESEGALIRFIESYFPSYLARSRRDNLTVAAGATSLNITSNYMIITGTAAVTIATIIGGYEGQIITLEFVDANVTITDTGTGATDTVDLSAAFTSSANDTLQLIYNGTSWREVGRSVN